MTWLWLKQVVKWLVLSPVGPLLVAYAGFVIARRRPRLGWRIALSGLVLLTLLTMPAVGILLERALDRSPALDPSKTDAAQAIVILSGGTRQNAREYGGPTLGPVSLTRVRYGARLSRLTGLPVLVSGGRVGDAPPEALLMRDVLTREFHIPVRWVETRSRNTQENAAFSAAILKANGVSRVILVGHAFDFPRAAKEFEAQGIQVVRAPINLPPEWPSELGDF